MKLDEFFRRLAFWSLFILTFGGLFVFVVWMWDK